MSIMSNVANLTRYGGNTAKHMVVDISLDVCTDRF